ncbi:MAG TPA: ClbS/DfsB family four-helix bundle protein [Candidatus Sulfomarinibacteraceae bacterium]|nr:ClbS/DfsB family four-helix bundle protein [Candidatus Sulfomarinibacteraceae bacterium]
MQKPELLDWLQQEYQEWEALLDEIGPERMEQPGVNGDWSMKDIVAHLTGWNRWLVTRLQAAQRGEPDPSPPWPAELEEEDDINAWIYETYRARSLGEILDETRQVHRQLVTAIEALPDDVHIEHLEPAFYLVWVDDQRFLVGEFFNHFHDDHEPDVRAWMA